MARMFLLRFGILFLLSLLLTIGFSNRGTMAPETQSPRAAHDEALLALIKSLSVSIRSVSVILKSEGIPVEPGLFFTFDGRKKVRAELAHYPDMSLSKTISEPLRGLVLADKITFPETAQIAADTLIIANHVAFTGRAPTIKGSYDFHFFAFESVVVQNGPETVITIDTSGSRGVDGIAGAVGNEGVSGTNGEPGTAGSCSAVRNGGVGGSGTHARPGENGGGGANGTAGTRAGHITLIFASLNTGSFEIIANGGNGGRGGAGGPGGAGGRGGKGGAGGNAAGCACSSQGIGEGGNGGSAGAGGAGGIGGQGGNGGNGGNGAIVFIAVPESFDYKRVKTTSRAGSGGRQGQAGRGGNGGLAGNPGFGGSGGRVNGCHPGRSGSGGSGNVAGAHGDHGNHGDHGPHGNGGHLFYTILNPKYGNSVFAGTYEPGITHATCTEWFLGRTFVGCF